MKVPRNSDKIKYIGVYILFGIALIGIKTFFSKPKPTFSSKQSQDYQFTQEETIAQALAIHGCHCSRLSLNFDQGFSASAPALDHIDEICRSWLVARNCITLPGGECHDVSDDIHDMSFESEVCDQSDACARDKCSIDNFYFDQINPTLEGWYFQANGWQVIPGTAQNCVDDMNDFVDSQDYERIDFGAEADFHSVGDDDYIDITDTADADFCVGKNNGRHHVDGDCSIFYVCENENVSKVTQCKTDQLFDKVSLICDDIDHVHNCDVDYGDYGGDAYLGAYVDEEENTTAASTTSSTVSSSVSPATTTTLATASTTSSATSTTTTTTAAAATTTRPTTVSTSTSTATSTTTSTPTTTSTTSSTTPTTTTNTSTTTTIPSTTTTTTPTTSTTTSTTTPTTTTSTSTTTTTPTTAPTTTPTTTTTTSTTTPTTTTTTTTTSTTTKFYPPGTKICMGQVPNVQIVQKRR